MGRGTTQDLKGSYGRPCDVFPGSKDIEPCSTGKELGADKNEQHGGRPITLVPPRMARAVLDDNIEWAQLLLLAVVKLQIDFTLDKHSVVHGVRGVHAWMLHLELLCKAWQHLHVLAT